MAQRTLTVLTCDLHDKDVDAVESVAFSVQGTSYEMDLCETHLKRFNDSLATFTAGARTGGHAVRGTKRTRRTSRRRTSASAGVGSETRVIREWAVSNGHSISAKGRIPAHIVEQYRAQS
ncbi:MAG: Lsr2 family protein [Frankiaceae bacterium]